MNIFSGTSTITSAEIARMAKVRPSAVSNWRNRENKHFPKPVDSKDGRPLFDYDQVAAWLKDNGIDFEDSRLEQAAWSFFEQWRGPMDPAAASSLLLWGLALGASARRFGLSAEWTEMASSDATASDAAVINRCERLVESILGKAAQDSGGFNVFQVALDDSRIRHSNDKTLRELLRFSDDLLSLGDAKANRLASMILERGIVAQGRMRTEFGCPNAPVSTLLAKLATSYVDSLNGSRSDMISVYDPACGIAEGPVQFIGIRRNSGNGTVGISLHGADINPDMPAIAARRLILMGVDDMTVTLHQQDSLMQDAFQGLRADIVMVEPPFSLRWNPDDLDARWRYGVPPRSDSALAWIQDAVAHLADGGRAFVVTPEGPLWRPNVESSIRRALVAAGCVEAIISLPSNLYMGTAIPTAIWVLTPPNASRDSVAMISTAAERDEYHGDGEPPAWMRIPLDEFSHDRTVTRVVRMVDILGKDSTPLLPTDWLERNTPDADIIADDYATRRAVLVELRSDAEEALRTIEDFDARGFDCSTAGMTTLGDIAAIKRGATPTVGRADPHKRIPLPEQPAVTASDVREHMFRPLASATDASEGTATQPGDILLTTAGEIHAMADMNGNHSVSTAVHVARLKSGEWNPEYVALMLEGEWNAHLMEGALVKRVRPAQLEVPRIPMEQQNRVVAYAHAVKTLRRQADLCRHQLDTVANAARYSAVLGTVMGDSKENGR
ncbi:N-6 DNA methylase [Bifidobacterium stellenboschense]|uniref:site-specific DNA-methyltransferase (adenine-specific) n=1 Tax=Bifidobacterium stellenboschense TaxID=762211 RepID=A0A087D972_9BIFI|nr:N-6 DNA methylase [Bifidobacterium stellenboschense]KFI92072.1 putative type I restriction system adenine methylase [Bifidobacterium stellenboschense]